MTLTDLKRSAVSDGEAKAVEPVAPEVPAPRAVTINDIPFDPATAEYVSVHAGTLYRNLEDYWRFDEVLFKVPEGYWFVLRPLAPDEARKWLRANGDDILLKQVFPDQATD